MKVQEDRHLFSESNKVSIAASYYDAFDDVLEVYPIRYSQFRFYAFVAFNALTLMVFTPVLLFFPNLKKTLYYEGCASPLKADRYLIRTSGDNFVERVRKSNGFEHGQFFYVFDEKKKVFKQASGNLIKYSVRDLERFSKGEVCEDPSILEDVLHQQRISKTDSGKYHLQSMAILLVIGVVSALTCLFCQYYVLFILGASSTLLTVVLYLAQKYLPQSLESGVYQVARFDGSAFLPCQESPDRWCPGDIVQLSAGVSKLQTSFSGIVIEGRGLSCERENSSHTLTPINWDDLGSKLESVANKNISQHRINLGDIISTDEEAIRILITESSVNSKRINYNSREQLIEAASHTVYFIFVPLWSAYFFYYYFVDHQSLATILRNAIFSFCPFLVTVPSLPVLLAYIRRSFADPDLHRADLLVAPHPLTLSILDRNTKYHEALYDSDDTIKMTIKNGCFQIDQDDEVFQAKSEVTLEPDTIYGHADVARLLETRGYGEYRCFLHFRESEDRNEIIIIDSEFDKDKLKESTTSKPKVEIQRIGLDNSEEDMGILLETLNYQFDKVRDEKGLLLLSGTCLRILVEQTTFDFIGLLISRKIKPILVDVCEEDVPSVQRVYSRFGSLALIELTTKKQTASDMAESRVIFSLSNSYFKMMASLSLICLTSMNILTSAASVLNERQIMTSYVLVLTSVMLAGAFAKRQPALRPEGTKRCFKTEKVVVSIFGNYLIQFIFQHLALKALRHQFFYVDPLVYNLDDFSTYDNASIFKLNLFLGLGTVAAYSASDAFKDTVWKNKYFAAVILFVFSLVVYLAIAASDHFCLTPLPKFFNSVTAVLGTLAVLALVTFEDKIASRLV